MRCLPLRLWLANVVAIAAAISPCRETRDQVRARIPGSVEIYVVTSFDECARRDTKGLNTVTQRHAPILRSSQRLSSLHAELAP